MIHKLAFVIGDTHGEYDLLQLAMKRIGQYISENSVDSYDIIMLGDYIDRGPNSRAIIEFLIQHPKIITLRGNHEQFLIDCFSHNLNPLPDSEKQDNMQFWMLNGGIQTLESYGCEFGPDEWLDCIPKTHVEWICNLPTFYETEHYYFVHAGLNPHKDIDDQYDKDRLWIRDKFLNNNHFFGKHVVHGHTPCREAEFKQYRTNLDAGSVFYGRQVIGVFELDVGPNSPIDVLWVGENRD